MHFHVLGGAGGRPPCPCGVRAQVSSEVSGAAVPLVLWWLPERSSRGDGCTGTPGPGCWQMAPLSPRLQRQASPALILRPSYGGPRSPILSAQRPVVGMSPAVETPRGWGSDHLTLPTPGLQGRQGQPTRGKLAMRWCPHCSTHSLGTAGLPQAPRCLGKVTRWLSPYGACYKVLDSLAWG